MMMMMTSSEKMKKKPPKDSLTLLPCFYFVEVRRSLQVDHMINHIIDHMVNHVINHMFNHTIGDDHLQTYDMRGCPPPEPTNLNAALLDVLGPNSSGSDSKLVVSRGCRGH